MRTVVIIEVEHSKPIVALADLIANRAWNIPGVENAEPVASQSIKSAALKSQGFTREELALGAQEVHRT